MTEIWQFNSISAQIIMLTFFKALTDALHCSFTCWILLLIADWFAPSTHSLCFSTKVTVFPSFESVTNSFVTGRGMILVRRWRSRSMPPTLLSKISSNQPLIVIKSPAFKRFFKVELPGTVSAVAPSAARRRQRRCSKIREAELPDAICWKARNNRRWDEGQHLNHRDIWWVFATTIQRHAPHRDKMPLFWFIGGRCCANYRSIVYKSTIPIPSEFCPQRLSGV